jgi:valyl-tRNA synthetase
MAAQGRDIKLAASRVEGYRNFATKLWNACRFAEMNACAIPADFDPTQAAQTLNRWIAHETARTTREVTEAIETYRFNDAAGAIYRFVWNVYCDWYLELAKPVLTGEEGGAKTETRGMVAWARDEILKLLHPFMPFITEELWAVTARRDGMLALAPWPRSAGTVSPVQMAAMSAANPDNPLMGEMLLALEAAEFTDPAAESEIGWVVDLVTAIRSVRAEMNIPPARLTPLVLAGTSAERLDKELAKAEADIGRVEAKLANEKFIANAPEEIIEEEREKREAAMARKTKILEALERLKSAA